MRAASYSLRPPSFSALPPSWFPALALTVHRYSSDQFWPSKQGKITVRYINDMSKNEAQLSNIVLVHSERDQ